MRSRTMYEQDGESKRSTRLLDGSVKLTMRRIVGAGGQLSASAPLHGEKAARATPQTSPFDAGSFGLRSAEHLLQISIARCTVRGGCSISSVLFPTISSLCFRFGLAAMSEKPTIGFVGLGAMGFGMAANLVKQGYHVKGFDVFPKSVERFQQVGGAAATSLADSATDAPFHVLMVASADQAQQALFGEGDSIVKGKWKCPVRH